jgi:thiol:disulfide interchange protein DsbD
MNRQTLFNHQLLSFTLIMVVLGCSTFNLALCADPVVTDHSIASTELSLAESSGQSVVKPIRKTAGKETPDDVEFLIQLKKTAMIDSKSSPQAILEIRANLNKAWHIFALDQNPEMSGLPTELKITSVSGISTKDSYTWQPDTAPEIEKPLDEITQRVHNEHVTWQTILGELEPDAAKIQVTGTISYQICNPRNCKLLHKVEFQVAGSIQELALGKVFSLIDSDVPTTSKANVPATETISETVSSESTQSTSSAPAPEFWTFLLTAIGAGYIALLTPCVFPMVPITVSVFLKTSGQHGHKPLTMATIFCLGIIGTFTIFGLLMSVLFGSAALNQFANNPWLNLFFAGVLIFFGCSMVGMFELVVPSWLLSWSSNQESRGGMIGILFMAFTFTLVSFTCTFAFVGTLLVWASNGQYFWPIIGMLGFSSAFASPFFFLALFPSYLQSLPKSGGWMNTLKATLGIIEIGAALKFLSVADISFFSEAYIFDYTLVMSIWMMLCFLIGMYLLGMFKLPHDMPTEKIPATQFLFAFAFLSLGAYLGAGVFAPKKPHGILWEQIEAFAPPVFNTKATVSQNKNDPLAMYKGDLVAHGEEGLGFAVNFNEAVSHADKVNRPLFIDFTGVNCINCRKMEQTVFPLPENHELLEQLVRVQLYTDSIPGISGTEKGKKLLEINTNLQQNWFKDATLPAYAIVSPDGKTILSMLSGYQPGEGVFTNFMKQGLEKFQSQQALVPNTAAVK